MTKNQAKIFILDFFYVILAINIYESNRFLLLLLFQQYIIFK